MGKHSRLIILICFVVSVVGFLFVLFLRPNKPKTSPPPTHLEPIKVANAQALTNDTEIGSPDGKWALKERREKTNDSTIYTYITVNLTSGAQKEILKKTVPEGTTITVPLNTFSPDDKYMFLKEEGPDGIKYLVFPGADVEVSSLFAAKYPEYVITDVTGWGGYSLLVVNTDKKEGGVGPSFWFEAGSHAFTKLSTRFN